MKPLTEKRLKVVLKAAHNMDWQQVVLNGGPPCFRIENGRFCGRAHRWHDWEGSHRFISLEDLIKKVTSL